MFCSQMMWDQTFLLQWKKLYKINKDNPIKTNIFNTIVDLVLNELNDSFADMNANLVLYVECPLPNDNIASYHYKKSP